MKKNLSPYWWCQIGGWSIFIVLSTLNMNPSEPNSRWDFVLPYFLEALLGIFITHLMRPFIVKAGIFQAKVFRQMIYMLLTTLFVAFIYALLIVVCAGILRWGERLPEYLPDEKNNITLLLVDITLDRGFFIGIWNAIYFVYYHIQKSQKEQIEKILLENKLRMQKLKSEKQQANLEMQALRSQMNPHFIFNSLNSISRFILKNQRVEANDYLTKFSRLIRMILQNSAMPTVKLANELNILQLYLELECLRFDKKIKYEFQCDPNLDTEFIQIPPLLLQPYIENAIWHGLMLKKQEGHLWIKIKQQENYLVCSVTDDGIGRKKAEELKNTAASTYKSMGMNITANRIALLNQSKQLKSEVKIVDRVLEDGSAGGTEVIINLPLYYD